MTINQEKLYTYIYKLCEMVLFVLSYLHNLKKIVYIKPRLPGQLVFQYAYFVQKLTIKVRITYEQFSIAQ